jgi:hypothetical protein
MFAFIAFADFLRLFDESVCFPVYGSLVRTIQRETYVPVGLLQMFSFVYIGVYIFLCVNRYGN